VPLGVPSALFERRPDIRQAEAQLAAATARIGVAKADYFPRVFLTGAAAGGGLLIDGSWIGPQGLFRFGPQIHLPIFNTGRTAAGVNSAEARAQAALFQYQQTIQQAFREVADALVEQRKRREIRLQQELLAQAADDTSRLADMRYKGGFSSYLEVLDSGAPVLRRGARAGAGPSRRAAGRGAALQGSGRRLAGVEPGWSGARGPTRARRQAGTRAQQHKIGVLAASRLAGAIGYLLLRLAFAPACGHAPMSRRTLGGTGDGQGLGARDESQMRERLGGSCQRGASGPGRIPPRTGRRRSAGPEAGGTDPAPPGGARSARGR